MGTEDAGLPASRRAERIVMGSNIPVLDTGMFDHMGRIAKMMASSGLVPAHLNSFKRVGQMDEPLTPEEALANCFLVVNQAVRWRMDPFAVAQGVFVLKGKVGYEGKLIAAVINSHPLLEGRLSYKYDGENQGRRVVVSGRIQDEKEDKTIEGTVGQWKTQNDSWTKIPDQMLAYRGAREWARRHMPEAILGVYADEELEFDQMPRTIQGEVVTERSATAQLRNALDTAGRTAESKRNPEDLKHAVAEASAKLAEHKDAETMTLFADTLDEDIRANEDFTKAFHKRLSELKAAAAAPGDPKAGELPLGGAKPAGTPRLRKAYLDRFGRADAETLPLALDETRAFTWTEEDQAALIVAFEERRKQLAGGGK